MFGFFRFEVKKSFINFCLRESFPDEEKESDAEDE